MSQERTQIIAKTVAIFAPWTAVSVVALTGTTGEALVGFALLAAAATYFVVKNM